MTTPEPRPDPGPTEPVVPDLSRRLPSIPPPAPAVPGALPGLRVVIITGLSGAGRSTAAKSLEDLGWFVVDNLPPSLLPTMADLGKRSQGAVTSIAAVVDVRTRAFFADLRAAVDALAARGIQARVLFLEASDEELVRRFENVRRPHPLQEIDPPGRLVDGIIRERELMLDLKGEADFVVDTTGLNVHDLRSKISAAFSDAAQPDMHAAIVSFGFKYGLPVDADVVVDCRFLPNPHWVPELRPHTGLDADVREHVLSAPGAGQFLDAYGEVLRVVTQGFRREGKRFLTMAVGCTGGKHRSVVMAVEIAGRLRDLGVDVQVSHRDVGRE